VNALGPSAGGHPGLARRVRPQLSTGRGPKVSRGSGSSARSMARGPASPAIARHRVSTGSPGGLPEQRFRRSARVETWPRLSPEAVSHRRAPFPLVVARRVPLGDHATLFTRSVWPVRRSSFSPVAVSHRRLHFLVFEWSLHAQY
jgi:hypothetical protein